MADHRWTIILKSFGVISMCHRKCPRATNALGSIMVVATTMKCGEGREGRGSPGTP